MNSVLEWPAPSNIRELQVILGFCNFYRNLIPCYSKLTSPFTALLKKDSRFEWTVDLNSLFLVLKNSFNHASVISHPDETKPFILETDASDFAIGGILSQLDNESNLRPVTFNSRQMSSAERNYEVYDKELLGVVDCFRHWRHYLQGSRHQTSVICDHKNLEYFMSTKQLARRQARWSLLLAEYDFVITYRPGRLNQKA